MPTITIKTGQGDHYIEFSPGRSLREVLDSTAFRVRSGCSGNGACGLCRVQIKAGDPAEPNQAERIYLSESHIASGVRLACQVMPQSDLEILPPQDQGPVSAWRAMSAPLPGPTPFSPILPILPKCSGRPCGVAVDLGTTHISLSFYDLSTGEWFAGRRGLNPQGTYGSDVMARLVAANESQQTALELRRLAVDAIGSGISDVFQQSAGEGFGGGAEQVARVVIVGNTAMLALLSGRNSHLLLQPAYWTRHIDCVAENAENSQELRLQWGIHREAAIEVMAPLAGFVGSDLLAGVLAARLLQGERGTLLIDFGTNSEIALWDGESLWVTSAAGGPAFEGCGIGCGSPAEPGAIYRVAAGPPAGIDVEENPADPGLYRGGGGIACEALGAPPQMDDQVFAADPGLHRGGGWSACDPPAAEGSGVFLNGNLGSRSYRSYRFETIDGEEPRGLCGSGIVDLIACLLESGSLTSIGRFSADAPQGKIVLLNGDGRQPLVLTKRDVDIFQRAKAAIFAAVRVLLSKASMGPEELRRVYVGGAFGHFLNKKSAAAVGLLPDLGEDGIHLCGNTALRGCEELLMSSGCAEIIDGLRDRAKLINLAQCGEFEDFFLEGLYLGRWADCNGKRC